MLGRTRTVTLDTCKQVWSLCGVVGLWIKLQLCIEYDI